MPNYSFRCPKCKYEFTDNFPMKQSDGKSVACPKCKAKGVERVWETFFTRKTSKDAFKNESSCPTCSSGFCGLNH